jgi:hypothetical protein
MSYKLSRNRSTFGPGKSFERKLRVSCITWLGELLGDWQSYYKGVGAFRVEMCENESGHFRLWKTRVHF